MFYKNLYFFFTLYFFSYLRKNFIKFLFFLINFFYKELVFFNRFVVLIRVCFLKYRFINTLNKFKNVLFFFKKKVFFFKRKQNLFLLYYFLNVFKKRLNLFGALNFKKFNFFLIKILNFFNRMSFFFFVILDTLKLYRKKEKILNVFINSKGRYFSKFYRKYKFVTFPTFKYWTIFNKKVLKYYFFNKNDIRVDYSFSRSIVLNRFLRAYFNIKRFKKLSYLVFFLKKKLNNRLRNFFFFFEMRVANLLLRLGFIKSIYYFKKYSKVVLFKAHKKGYLLVKNINYTVRVNDLVSLFFKTSFLNKFYIYNLSNFLEINYFIKSFFVVRFPFISEIVSNWFQKVFNRSLYNSFFL